jgi:hypothetical protein
MRVSDDVFAEVSTAVVVRHSYLTSPDFTNFWLTWGVGLEPAQGLDFEPLPETGSKYLDGVGPAITGKK